MSELPDCETALMKLGLTKMQVKTYLAVLSIRNNNRNTKVIAQRAKIDRANIYRTIIRLHELGLIRIILGKPNTYKALALEDAVKLLLKKRSEELNNAKEEVSEIVKIMQKFQNKNEYLMNEGDGFQICPGYSDTIIKTALSNSKESFDVVFDISSALNGLDDDDLIGLSKRGVKFRVLLFDDGNREKYLSVLQKNPSYKKAEFRITDELPKAVISIMDKKEVFLQTAPITTNWIAAPILRSTNACLLGILQKYFEDLWSEAEIISDD